MTKILKSFATDYQETSEEYQRAQSGIYCNLSMLVALHTPLNAPEPYVKPNVSEKGKLPIIPLSDS